METKLLRSVGSASKRSRYEEFCETILHKFLHHTTAPVERSSVKPILLTAIRSTIETTKQLFRVLFEDPLEEWSRFPVFTLQTRWDCPCNDEEETTLVLVHVGTGQRVQISIKTSITTLFCLKIHASAAFYEKGIYDESTSPLLLSIQLGTEMLERSRDHETLDQFRIDELSCLLVHDRSR